MIPGIVAMQAAGGGPLKPSFLDSDDVFLTASMTSPTFFEPSTSTYVLVSNNKLTATHNPITYPCGTRSISYQSSGKFYYEVTWTTVHGDQDFCSLITASESYGDMTATYPKGAVIFRSNGTIYSNGSLSGGGQLGYDIASGSVMQIAVDLNAKRVWFRTGTGYWNGDSAANPATGVGGKPVNAVQSFAPAVGFGGAFATVNDTMTANFGATAFTYSMPAGYAKWPSTFYPTKLNPASAVNVTLSNSDTTATHSNTSDNSGVRGANALASGKVYFEVVMTNITGNFTCCGLFSTSSSATSMSQFVTSRQYCNKIDKQGGNIWIPGHSSTPVASLGDLVNGDIIQMAFDVFMQYAWFRKNGTGNWNNNSAADPAAGTGGLAMSNDSWTPCLGFGGTGTTTGESMTANFIGFSFTPPDGFGPWP